MGGNMMMLLMMLMTTWMIWWAPTPVGAEDVSFSTKDATEETYDYFIEEVRGQLKSGKDKYGIPILRRKSEIQKDEQRFLLVKLTSSAGESITLALDVTNAQLVAYQATDDLSFFFKNAPKPQSKVLFPDTEPKEFEFTSSYEDLTEKAQAKRSEIPLGMTRLSTAIQDLHGWSSGPQQTLARGLLVIIQMVSGAARISYIQQAVTNKGVGSGEFTPDCAAISFEDKWERLSTAILTAKSNGQFQNPVELQRPSCKNYEVRQVNDYLKYNLALLKSNLAISPSPQVLGSVPSGPVLRSVVAAEDQENIINELIMAVRKFSPGRQNKWFTIQA